MSKAYKCDEVVKKTCDPVYLQTFSININSDSLADVCLELAIFSISSTSKSFLGGARLSHGTGNQVTF